jgi:hypothetical protein
MLVIEAVGDLGPAVVLDDVAGTGRESDLVRVIESEIESPEFERIACVVTEGSPLVLEADTPRRPTPLGWCGRAVARSTPTRDPSS